MTVQASSFKYSSFIKYYNNLCTLKLYKGLSFSSANSSLQGRISTGLIQSDYDDIQQRSWPAGMMESIVKESRINHVVDILFAPQYYNLPMILTSKGMIKTTCNCLATAYNMHFFLYVEKIMNTVILITDCLHACELQLWSCTAHISRSISLELHDENTQILSFQRSHISDNSYARHREFTTFATYLVLDDSPVTKISSTDFLLGMSNTFTWPGFPPINSYKQRYELAGNCW